VKERRRVGRGIAGKGGKTAGRGTKGEQARGSVPPGFAGGNVKAARRMPKKRGTTNRAHNIGIFHHEFAIINLSALDRFEAGTVVTPELLLEHRVVRNMHDGVKVLGGGEVTRSLEVHAHAFSAGAREKIEAAGGKAEVIA
jgi:large subunit ribosomal protein L15